MKPLACLIALWAIIAVQATNSDTTLTEDITKLFSGAQNMWGSLIGHKTAKNSPIVSVDEASGTSAAAYSSHGTKHLKSIDQSADKLWHVIEGSSQVPEWVKPIGNSIIDFATNLNGEKIQEAIDIAAEDIVALLPLSSTAKTDIIQYISKIVKPFVNSALVLKGSSFIRFIAQIASVSLSIIISIGLALQSLIVETISNTVSITKTLPEFISEGKEIIETGIEGIKSELESIHVNDHPTESPKHEHHWQNLDSGDEHKSDQVVKQVAYYFDNSPQNSIHVNDHPTESPKHEHHWQNLDSGDEHKSDQVVKQVAYYFDNSPQNSETKSQKVIEQANSEWTQSVSPQPAQSYSVINHANLPVHNHIEKHSRQKLVPLTYQNIQQNYQEPSYQPPVIPVHHNVHNQHGGIGYDHHHSPKPYVQNHQLSYQYDGHRNLGEGKDQSVAVAATKVDGGISAGSVAESLFK